MRDSRPAFHNGLVTFLRAAPEARAYVAQRTYDRPPQGVAFPYVGLGRSRTDRFRYTGGRDGVTIYQEVHVWSRAGSGGAHECGQITAALADLLDDARVTIAGHTLVGLFVEATDVIRMGDGLTHQGVINLRADTLAA